MRPRPRHEARRETGGLPLPALIGLAIVLLIGLAGVAFVVPQALAGGPATSSASTPLPGSPDRTLDSATGESATPSATGSLAPSPSVTVPSVSATPSPTATRAASSPKPSPKATGPTAIEDQVTSLVNIERKKVGCGALRTDERLRTAARAHSADMVRYDYFGHDGHDGKDPGYRMTAAGYSWSAWAENIAYGYASAAEVVKGWMNSDGHRKNILNCNYRDVGVGLAYKGSTPYWTQDFGKP
jgi:uncharacterized protein YkwD